MSSLHGMESNALPTTVLLHEESLPHNAQQVRLMRAGAGEIRTQAQGAPRAARERRRTQSMWPTCSCFKDGRSPVVSQLQ